MLIPNFTKLESYNLKLILGGSISTILTVLVKVKLLLQASLISYIKTNGSFESIPFAKLISKMGSFANWEQMLWKQDGSNLGKQQYQDPFIFEQADNDYPLQRVTGEKTEKGLPTGIFGNGEFVTSIFLTIPPIKFKPWVF